MEKEERDGFNPDWLRVKIVSPFNYDPDKLKVSMIL